MTKPKLHREVNTLEIWVPLWGEYRDVGTFGDMKSFVGSDS
jgi:hypothetical protein